jgi:hypothetical protein
LGQPFVFLIERSANTLVVRRDIYLAAEHVGNAFPRPPSPKMRAMESDPASARKSFRWALGASLLLHAAVLFIGYAPSRPSSRFGVNLQGNAEGSPPRLIASLVGPTRRPSAPSRPEAAVDSARHKPAPHRQRTPPPELSIPPARQWSQAERDEMNRFLNGLAAKPRPATGLDLAQRALAMASQIGRTPQDQGEDKPAGTLVGDGKAIEPLSWEMYFDAFLRKLNHSAAFVPRPAGVEGGHRALVLIALNADGSLKDYRVLRAADQQSEIGYVKRVLERAAPFSAFPPDIRKATDSLTITMCIYPPHDGWGGGFSRSFGGQDCGD